MYFSSILTYQILQQPPKTYAGYLLFHSAAQKLHYTNFGINFYLYVISGSKFRADLLTLVLKKKMSQNNTSVSTISNI